MGFTIHDMFDVMLVIGLVLCLAWFLSFHASAKIDATLALACDFLFPGFI